ncbi:MAG: DUF4860 domain-containing protein [Clostridia bacterium]|nr:DUF4860 domain-containing protein [Clostridia bacterium]
MSKSENNGNAITNHAIGGLFIFCLIALFAVMAVTLTLTGMKAYQSVSEASAGNSEAQIVLSYLLNKTHAMDVSGAVSIREEQGLEYLCLDEYWEDEVYQTRIYAMDGQMLEYYCGAEDEFSPELGDPLADVQELSFAMESPRLLAVSVTLPDGTEEQLHIALRSQEVSR